MFEMLPKLLFPSCAGVMILLHLLLTPSANAEDKEALLSRLARADRTTNIEAPEMKPWTLKVNFQLYDDQGKPGEQGTLEESWASPTLYKQMFTSPSYTATILRNGKGLFRTVGMAEPPYLLGLLQRQINHPLPSEKQMEGFSPQSMKTPPGMPECIMYSHPVRRMAFPPLGLFPTYCMVPEKDILQVNYEDGIFLVQRRKVGSFQQKTIPLDLTVMVTQVGIEKTSAVKAMTSHMVMLKQAPLTEADFTTPESGMVSVTETRKSLNYAKLKPVEPGLINPVVPMSATQSMLSDPAQVRVVYGTDGRVRAMQLFTAPDPVLAASALQAVRNWPIHPQMDGDKPIQVETIIEVTFNRDAKLSETGGHIN